ncbi:hypothetical protein [Saccharopolyspora sp. CA-218241]|uniref:hypothetical protein n=1 Tax=Saccharopolyspora sp. CA-218241 TaxID=3240027 RepID=UPI003D954F4C
MEIVASEVEATGAHGPVLAPTSLRLRAGALLLITGPPGPGPTALGLALTGRLRPDRGSVRHDGALDPRGLRRRTALVDSPDITAPDDSVPVRTAVAEGLSLAGRRSGRRRVRRHLDDSGVAHHADDRFERLPPHLRIRLLLDLACADPRVRALVLDAPDRHGGHPLDWYSPARQRAANGLAVAVLCAPHSARALGVPAARIGADHDHDPATGGAR